MSADPFSETVTIATGVRRAIACLPCCAAATSRSLIMINYLALSAAEKVVIAHGKTKRNSSADLPGNVSLST
ncbi:MULTISPECIES: hypothetical protein, partial [unclassified Pseudomonas]|uniref:hypothetical protein n=1 Tax=unclassified Pseudomonas TaxID=196821 RepID=UPI001C441721